MGVVRILVTDVDGEVHTLVSEENEDMSIVDMAERQWLEFPYSCRSWACFTCCATVEAWGERLEQNKTGEQLIDVEEWEFLTCIGWCRPEAYNDGGGKWEAEIKLTLLN